MITITPDNQIDRDGEIIGNIIGGIAWMKAKPAGRIAGQIRQVAGIDGLKFEVADAPPPESPPISAVQVVDALNVSEPVASCDDLAAGTAFDVATFGEPGSEYFRRCFVNIYSNDAYAAFMKSRGL
jgi:hypothetical protein